MSDEFILNWLASWTYSDSHYGQAVTEEKMAKLKDLQNKYENEIELTKLELYEIPNFDNLPYEEKNKIASEILADLIKDKEEQKTR